MSIEEKLTELGVTLPSVAPSAGAYVQAVQVVRIEVFVQSAPGFSEQAQVANGASQLLHEIFGPAGQHCRLALGVAQLPLNATVELAMILEVK